MLSKVTDRFLKIATTIRTTVKLRKAIRPVRSMASNANGLGPTNKRSAQRATIQNPPSKKATHRCQGSSHRVRIAASKTKVDVTTNVILPALSFKRYGWTETKTKREM